MPGMDLLHLPGLPFPPGRQGHPGKEKGRSSCDDSSGRTRWDGVGRSEGGALWLASKTGGRVGKWQLARPFEGWKEFLPSWRVEGGG